MPCALVVAVNVTSWTAAAGSASPDRDSAAPPPPLAAPRGCGGCAPAPGDMLLFPLLARLPATGAADAAPLPAAGAPVMMEASE